MARYDEDAEDISSTGGKPPCRIVESLKSLNYQCLELLAQQAAAGSTTSFALGEVIREWQQLDEAARRRAADYPFLLFDAGFADPQRWQQLDAPRVSDGYPAAHAPFFTVPDAVAVTRSVFVFASSMAQRHRTYARLALGMHPQCVRIIAAHSVLHVHQMAEHWWSWLQPRWPHTPEIWRELLTAGPEGGEVHRRARMHGMRLLEAHMARAVRSRSGGSGP